MYNFHEDKLKVETRRTNSGLYVIFSFNAEVSVGIIYQIVLWRWNVNTINAGLYPQAMGLLLYRFTF